MTERLNEFYYGRVDNLFVAKYNLDWAKVLTLMKLLH
jgi:hypothetical protein